MYRYRYVYRYVYLHVYLHLYLRIYIFAAPGGWLAALRARARRPGLGYYGIAQRAEPTPPSERSAARNLLTRPARLYVRSYARKTVLHGQQQRRKCRAARRRPPALGLRSAASSDGGRPAADDWVQAPRQRPAQEPEGAGWPHRGGAAATTQPATAGRQQRR